jgi:hypothetical protein
VTYTKHHAKKASLVRGLFKNGFEQLNSLPGMASFPLLAESTCLGLAEYRYSHHVFLNQHLSVTSFE